MIVKQLMADLTQAGIRLKAEGERLRYFPRTAMTPNLADRVKAHKPELLAALAMKDERQQAHAQQEGKEDEDKFIEVYSLPQIPTETSELSRRCWNHQDQRWWRSIYGDHLICGICCPPTVPGVLREWVLDY